MGQGAQRAVARARANFDAINQQNQAELEQIRAQGAAAGRTTTQIRASVRSATARQDRELAAAQDAIRQATDARRQQQSAAAARRAAGRAGAADAARRGEGSTGFRAGRANAALTGTRQRRGARGRDQGARERQRATRRAAGTPEGG